MKKFLGLIACIFMLNVAIGQNEGGTAIVSTQDKIDNTNGVYVFQFDQAMATPEMIDKQTAHYTDFFKVERSVQNGMNTIKIKLNAVEYENKKVIQRLLISLDLQNVNYKNKTYKTDEFIKEIILN